MVPDGQVQPVFEEGRLIGAEHFSNVRRVVARDVEVGVITDVAREQHLDVLLRDQCDFREGFICAERIVSAFLLEQAGDGVADSLPFGLRTSHEIVHEGSLESVSERVVGKRCAEWAVLLCDKSLEGECEVSDGDADVVCTIGKLCETPR